MNHIQSNKLLLNAMTKAANGQVICKTIPFKNNDVPVFLKRLDKFEKQSRKCKLVIK